MGERDCCLPFRNKCCFCRVEWAMWANMMCFWAAWLLFGSAFFSIFFFEEVTPTDTYPSLIGYYTRYIVLGLSPLIILIEYPISRKRNGKMVEPRLFQQYVAPIIRATYFFGSEYLFRFLFYAIVTLLSFTLLSLISGGLCLAAGTIVYGNAIFYGEKWRAPEMAWGPWKDEQVRKGGKKGAPNTRGTTISRPPAQPPPRAPEKELGLELSEGPPSGAAPTMP